MILALNCVFASGGKLCRTVVSSDHYRDGGSPHPGGQLVTTFIRSVASHVPCLHRWVHLYFHDSHVSLGAVVFVSLG
jgi:hypothetical protein